MLEKEDKYDPSVYGQLRAKFLNALDSSIIRFDGFAEEEKRRQTIMKEIREGKLVIIK